MRKLILIMASALSACTVNYTPDVARFNMIDTAVGTKADAATTAANFKFLADELNKTRQEVQTLKTQKPDVSK
jgi:hypothetical protein